MKNLLIVLLMAFAFTVTGCKSDKGEKGEVKVVSSEEMESLLELENVQLVDIRTPEEYIEGYIDGFQNIDFLAEDFDANIQKLDKTKPVIIYCRSGRRSASCSEKMLEAGFVKIYDLDGGISKWKHNGLELKTKS